MNDFNQVTSSPPVLHDDFWNELEPLQDHQVSTTLSSSWHILDYDYDHDHYDSFWNEPGPIDQDDDNEQNKAASPPNVNDGEPIITREVLACYFHMDEETAAKELNMGKTLLQKWCRKLGLKRWPYRKLEALNNVISNFHNQQEEAVAAGDDHKQLRLEANIRFLEEQRKVVMDFPDRPFERYTEVLIKASYKVRYKSKRKLNG